MVRTFNLKNSSKAFCSKWRYKRLWDSCSAAIKSIFWDLHKIMLGHLRDVTDACSKSSPPLWWVVWTKSWSVGFSRPASPESFPNTWMLTPMCFLNWAGCTEAEEENENDKVFWADSGMCLSILIRTYILGSAWIPFHANVETWNTESALSSWNHGIERGIKNI